jgi:valyl-tRNA synthetase
MKEVNEKLLKPYNPADTEGRIYDLWEKSGFFNPDHLPTDHTTPFTVIMPPPNANGRLHAGHFSMLAIQDLIIRYKRMRGFKTLWVPGADHAGFETQIVYEKKLEKEGRTRFDLTPEDLYKEILAFTLENKKYMEDQVKKSGASCDWSREKFTLDESIITETQKTFQKMFDDGLVYRGKRIVNWCAKHQTSLSDVETEFKEQTDKFYYFKYGPFTIGTSRPETKFGDKYVVMHPDDTRYTDHKHGDKIDLEWINGPITATIIKDEAIDMEFGTGVMTITLRDR